jgi:hypothetical protein
VPFIPHPQPAQAPVTVAAVSYGGRDPLRRY